VAEFQVNVGEQADGIVGPGSVDALERIRPAVEGPSRTVVREAESIRHLHRSLEHCRVAIDPGHSPADPGGVGARGLVEAEATMLLAQDLADELAARGSVPLLLRREDEDTTPSERARAANELGADLCVSLHLNSGEPTAEGSTCSYFGTEETYSPAGQHLAEAIQKELTSRLRLTDGRTHRLAVPILRETRMPAVLVEPCFLTNPDEEALLAHPASRREMAGAIAAGLERFFRTAPSDETSDG
jgi:N-acetylmuramoyl-L-alanine amidase